MDKKVRLWSQNWCKPLWDHISQFQSDVFWQQNEAVNSTLLPGIQCIKRQPHKWPLGHRCQQRGQGHPSGTLKSTSEERTSLQHHRTPHGLWGISQGQGHTVVNPHRGAEHPTQQTPGSQGKLGAHLLLGWLNTVLTSTDWDSILSLWIGNNTSSALQVLGEILFLVSSCCFSETNITFYWALTGTVVLIQRTAVAASQNSNRDKTPGYQTIHGKS